MVASKTRLSARRGRVDLRVPLVAAAGLIASVSASQAQVELKTYMDDKGYINVRALTCAQLANTFQEDADFLGAWYSGWWNGHMKRHSVNIARAKDGIHEVIVYCKANPDTKVVDAVDAYVKKVQAGGK
jgi:HdeA/HdeB family